MPDVPSDPKDVVRRFFATLATGDFAAIGEFCELPHRRADDLALAVTQGRR